MRVGILGCHKKRTNLVFWRGFPFNCEPDSLYAVTVELNTASIGLKVEPAGAEVRPVSFELATVACGDYWVPPCYRPDFLPVAEPLDRLKTAPAMRARPRDLGVDNSKSAPYVRRTREIPVP